MSTDDRPTLAIGVLVALVLLLIGTPPILQAWAGTTETSQKEWVDFSEIVRNFGLMFFAAIGLVLALRRTNTATDQAETANKQAKQAELGHIVDRYHKGTEMLESTNKLTRLTGVTTLRELATTRPNDYYVTIAEQLTIFAVARSQERKSTNKIKNGRPIHEPLGADAYAALYALTTIRGFIQNWAKREKDAGIRCRVTGAEFSDCRFDDVSFANMIIEDSNFRGTFFNDADMSGCTIQKSNFENGTLLRTDLNDTHLIGCDFFDANFWGARLKKVRFGTSKLKDADFDQAEISGAFFVPRNISKEQTKYAWAWSDQHPRGLPSDWGLCWQRYYPGRRQENRKRYEADGTRGEPTDVERLPWNPLEV